MNPTRNWPRAMSWAIVLFVVANLATTAILVAVVIGVGDTQDDLQTGSDRSVCVTQATADGLIAILQVLADAVEDPEAEAIQPVTGEQITAALAQLRTVNERCPVVGTTTTTTGPEDA